MLTLLLIPIASAYSLAGYAWSPDRLPVELHWTGEQEGFTHDELRAAIEGAADAWQEAAPCPLQIVVVENPEAESWFAAGGVAFLFGDPNDEVPDGVLVMAIPGAAPEATFWSNGVELDSAPGLEVVFDDGDYWLPNSAINGGECTEQFSLQGMLTHGIGEVLGLATLQEGSPQTGSEATMSWSLGVCDTSWSTLETDDIDGLEALYGGSYGYAWSCARNADDNLTVDCAATGVSDAEGLLATWDFGDGATAQGGIVSHTYAVEDTYWIEVCFPSTTCDEGRCDRVEHRAGDPIPASEPWSAWNGESDDTCEGCAAADDTARLGLVALAVWIVGRRLG